MILAYKDHCRDYNSVTWFSHLIAEWQGQFIEERVPVVGVILSTNFMGWPLQWLYSSFAHSNLVLWELMLSKKPWNPDPLPDTSAAQSIGAHLNIFKAVSKALAPWLLLNLIEVQFINFSLLSMWLLKIHPCRLNGKCSLNPICQIIGYSKYWILLLLVAGVGLWSLPCEKEKVAVKEQRLKLCSEWDISILAW